MRERAQVRPNRATPETRTLPTQKAACTWAHRPLVRYPGSISSADTERPWS